MNGKRKTRQSRLALRITAAAEGAGRSKFDQRIRKQVADHTGTRPCTAQQLRDAVPWREIFGPQVNLARESGSDSSP